MSTAPSPHASAAPSVPERLLRLLDRLGTVLAHRGDAIALLGLGSVGRDLHRLDEHSDADFFVVVDAGAETAYLREIDWLEATAPIAWSFVNSPHGRKVLFADGLFAEYAVFTLTELAGAGYPPARTIWRRADAPAGLEEPAVPLPPTPALEEQVGEAVTNLYVGLHRDLRGERLTATRFIQGYAVDRLVMILGLVGLGDGGQQDPFVVERGVERRFPATVLPLGDLVPGYDGNGRAALALLDVLERHVAVPAPIASAVRELGARSAAAAEERASAGQSSSRT